MIAQSAALMKPFVEDYLKFCRGGYILGRLGGAANRAGVKVIDGSAGKTLRQQLGLPSPQLAQGWRVLARLRGAVRRPDGLAVSNQKQFHAIHSIKVAPIIAARAPALIGVESCYNPVAPLLAAILGRWPRR